MRRTRVETFIKLLLTIGFITAGAQNCNTGWEKIEGVKPEAFSDEQVFYTGKNSEGIVSICFERCLKSTNCSAFYIDFGRSVCTKVELEAGEFEPAPSFSFYQKICLQAPPNCMKERWWQVQRTLGAVLIDTTVTWLPETFNRSQCYEKCIQAGDACKSAQFRTSKPLAIGDVEGKCALLSIERGTRPQSYRASMYRDEYLETQCHNLSKSDYCSYAEFRNQTLQFSDLMLSDLDEQQCENRCNSGKDGFICRGYTIDYANAGGDTKLNCLLHADDTISAGVSSLMKTTDAIYREREPCINLKVSCGNTSLVIELETPDPFYGRLYTSGYSEICDTQGTGSNKTILTLAIPDKEEMPRGNIDCGIIPAYAIETDNQTRVAIWVTVVVQFNPIIQRLGDQSVRVGCSLDDGEVPLPRNITVHSEFSFTSPDAGHPPIVDTIFNSTTQPIVMMRILDEEMNEITSAELGQRLVLKIEIYPSDGPYDIAAGHLVASSTSGDSSILLLDERGCPSDPRIFPAMTKDPDNNRSIFATFTAFKFPESHRVKFNVMIKFCMAKCEATRCRNGIVSYGRRRRFIAQNTIPDDDINKTINELPLEWSITIRDAVISADPLRFGKNPDTFLIAGEQPSDRLLCVDVALALELLIVWLIIQILMTLTCIYVIRRYRRLARKAEEDRAVILARHLYGIHGGNFEIARRVRWADHNESSIS